MPSTRIVFPHEHNSTRINLTRTLQLHHDAATAASAHEAREGLGSNTTVEPMAAVKLDPASEAQYRAIGYSAVRYDYRIRMLFVLAFFSALFSSSYLNFLLDMV